MSADRKPLILASTSRYRAELLARLGIGFECVAPRCDETPLPGESPNALAARLARAKALDVAARAPGRIVVGSDQTAALGSELLDKPGSSQAQAAMLRRCSGNTVVFFTAVCVIADGSPHEASVETLVRFRSLDAAEISRYVAREPAPDCCGGFRVEGLGITLFDAVESEDPTALIGLPLIAVVRLLRRCGLALP